VTTGRKIAKAKRRIPALVSSLKGYNSGKPNSRVSRGIRRN